MRTIWLASTALLMTAGVACAQSTSTSQPSPAPTGAVSAPKIAPKGDSPGNMGTNTGTMGSQSSSGSMGGQAPDGAVSAPDVTAAAPKAAPGKMAPAPSSGMGTGGTGGMAATPMTGSSASASSSMAMPVHHHSSHGMSAMSGGLPADGSPSSYLNIAKHAIAHHEMTLADDALSHAETRLLDRSVPQGGIAADDSPAIQSIESARMALHSGNYTKASADTAQAASAAGGM